jgi:hypothetical protein
LLGHRQRVQLGPDRHAGAGLRPDAHDPPGAADRGRVGGTGRRGHRRRRAVLGSGQLGVRVQVVPEPDRFAKLAGQRRAQRRVQAGAAHGACNR